MRHVVMVDPNRDRAVSTRDKVIEAHDALKKAQQTPVNLNTIEIPLPVCYKCRHPVERMCLSGCEEVKGKWYYVWRVHCHGEIESKIVQRELFDLAFLSGVELGTTETFVPPNLLSTTQIEGDHDVRGRGHSKGTGATEIHDNGVLPLAEGERARRRIGDVPGRACPSDKDNEKPVNR